MEIKIEDFECVILPAKSVSAEFEEYYTKTYNCWRDVWTSYQKEMKQEVHLPSDMFTRQEEIISLFYQGECAGLIFCRVIDFNEEPSKHDSYFSNWPEIVLHKLHRNGKRILNFSQFSIHAKFRKGFNGISWKDLLMAVGYERFIRSNCDAGCTAVRVQKHMDDTAYLVGATPLLKGLPFHETQNVDLVGFFHDEVCRSQVPGIADLASAIYQNTKFAVPSYQDRKGVKRVA